MLAELPEVAVGAFLDVVGPDSGTTLLMAELRQLGGALGRPHEGGGALTHLDGAFAAFGAAIAATPEMAAQGQVDATRFTSALEPYANGASYLNFAENEVDARTAYDADRWTQLKGIKSAVDPKGVIVANHRIPRLWENGRATD